MQYARRRASPAGRLFGCIHRGHRLHADSVCGRTAKCNPRCGVLFCRVGNPTFQYAEDTSRWRSWQHEYRYGGFYIFPPHGVIEDVDALRLRYDPLSARACQAHVSLSEPVPRALEQSDVDELRELLAAVEPFMITYDQVHATLPYAGVVYRIRPVEDFQRLRDLVHTASAFGGSSFPRASIPPHMTIAEFISAERSVEVEAELRGQIREGEWMCEDIEYAIPDNKMTFHRVFRLPLGRYAPA
jgi:hypothetical protein